MLQLLWQGINLVQNQYPIDKQYSTYPVVFQLLYTDYKCIYWDQLFYEQLAAFWVYYIDHSTGYTNRTIFDSQVIVCIIWQ